jgi:F0F1-type ATP synthase delta subunit
MNILIESAIKLETAEHKEIESILSKKYSDATFSYVVNPTIIGGLRITMGGKRIDLSLAGKVQQVEKALQS